MKDNRANIKVQTWTRDRLMKLKYQLKLKSIDQLLNEFMDDFWSNYAKGNLENGLITICMNCGSDVDKEGCILCGHKDWHSLQECQKGSE